jgi:hypothetical protein
MKKFLLVLQLMLLSITLSSQTGWVQSISSDGIKTIKQCKGLVIEPTHVIFYVSGSTYEIFSLAGTDLEGNPLWKSEATGKNIFRVVQPNGLVVFHKSEKKAYYYNPEK